MQRSMELSSICHALKAIIGDLRTTASVNNLDHFKRTAQRVYVVTARLSELELSARKASEGYLSNPPARRAFDLASRELDASGVQLAEWVQFANVANDKSDMDKLIAKLGAHEIELRRVTFAPGLPRPKITKDELHQIIADETSQASEQLYRPAPQAKNVQKPQSARMPSTWTNLPTAKELVDQAKQDEKPAPLTEPVNEERMRPMNPDEQQALRDEFLK